MPPLPTLDPDNPDSELLFLLNARSPDWPRLEQIFAQRFPLVPARLVQKLGEHYLQGDFPPPENAARPGEDAATEAAPDASSLPPALEACLRYYQAYGYVGSSLQATWRRWQRRLPAPSGLFPAPLAWTAGAVLQHDCAASLDSPLVHAWVYEADGQAVEVVLCGRGTGWIRQQVDRAILAARLALPGCPDDILLEGVARLTLAPQERRALQPPNDPLVFGLLRPPVGAPGAAAANHAASMGNAATANAQAILAALVELLSQLERRTGLVKVLRCPAHQATRLRQSIDEGCLAQRQPVDPTGPAAPASEWSYTAPPDLRLAVPYALPGLCLRLPLSLAKSAAYQRLHDLYQNWLVRSAAADALRRINFYTQELNAHQRDLEQYQNPQRRELLPLKVALVVRVDYDLGLAYRLSEPEIVSRDEYYGRRIPRFIRLDIEWIRRMRAVLHDLAQAVGQPGSSLNRMTMSRLFDAALRDQPLAGASEAPIAEAFQAWKAEVQPFLWLLWQRALQEQGLAPGHLHSRQLFFNLDIDLENQELSLRPYYLVDTRTSRLAFDPQAAAPRLLSAYDVQPAQPGAVDRPLVLAQLAAWEQQVQAGEPAERCRATLKNALAQDPGAVMKEILQRYRQPAVQPEAYRGLIHAALRPVHPLLGFRMALRLWQHNAIQSACGVMEQVYQEVERAPRGSPIQGLPDIPMLLAWLRGVQRYGQQAQEALMRIRAGAPRDSAERTLQRLMAQAAQRSPGYVNQWFRSKDAVLSRDMQAALAAPHLREDELFLLSCLQALASVHAAQELAQAAADLEPGGETPRSIYARLGPAMEALWASPLAGEFDDALSELVNLLLGAQVD